MLVIINVYKYIFYTVIYFNLWALFYSDKNLALGYSCPDKET